MKSIKNHLSLVIALLSILFAVQVFLVTERAVLSYKENLASNYSLVIVAKKLIPNDVIKNTNGLIAEVTQLTPDSVISKLNTGMDKKNIELLKLTLPKFYKLRLVHYPSPSELEHLQKQLLRNTYITKVETFSHNHDTVYKLLLLFKNVIYIFSVTIFLVTILLIFKELRIWQFKHSERMNIMGLFGSPTWLRSAVLFRLAIVDAIISSLVAFVLFSYMASNTFILEQFRYIGINIVLFNPIDDFLLLFGVALVLSVMLATMIVLGHKEEV